MHVSRCSQITVVFHAVQALAILLTIPWVLSSCRKQKKASDGLSEAAALLAAVDGPVAFGAAALNTTKDATLTITNSGSVIATSITATALTYPFRFKDSAYPGTGGTCLPVIQVRATCTLVLQYAPTLSGTHEGKLTLNYMSGLDSSKTVSTEIAILGGNATNGAALNISDGTTYNYGNIVVGNTSDKSFTVSNDGLLSASSIAAGTPALAAPYTWKGGSFPGTGGNCGSTLSVGSSCTIVVRFTPTASGVASDTIRIAYNDGLTNQSATRAITGTGQSPASLGISNGATYDYSNQYETLSTDKTFTVTNGGEATATSLTTGTPALAAPYGYKGGSFPGTGGNCGSSLTGAASCTIVVTFSPTATGVANDTIRLSYNNGVTSQSATRAVTGTGVGYAALSISDGATYNYGSKYVNTTNTDKSFTVTNSLSGTASGMSGAALSAPFAYKGGSYPGTGGDCGASLAGGATCTIVVRYSPTTLGAHSGTLTVNYTRPDASSTTATRAMSGTGIGAPGDIDTTWNTTGKQYLAIGSANERAYAVAVQSDGKVLVAGYSYNGSNNDFAIARYGTSGSLDTDFGTAGVKTVDISGNDTAYALVIQSDGKILMGGLSGTAGNYEFTIVRLSTAGALDSTYGASGVVTTNFNGLDDYIRGMALDSNGKLVVVGPSIGLAGNMRFGVARYTTDGSLDTSFDSDGKATYQPVSGADNDAYSVAIQSDGKLVIAGTSMNGTYRFSVARISSSGSLDTGFNTNGYQTIDVTGGTDIVKTAKIDSSSRVVLGGSNGSNTMTVVRLTSAGALDTNFDSDGIQTVDIGSGADVGNAMEIDSNGKILIVGSATNTDKDFGVARLTTAGALDTTFGSSGVLSTDYALGGGTNDNSIHALALQSDGKIIAAGDYDTGANADFAIFRYWP